MAVALFLPFGRLAVDTSAAENFDVVVVSLGGWVFGVGLLFAATAVLLVVRGVKSVKSIPNTGSVGIAGIFVLACLAYLLVTVGYQCGTWHAYFEDDPYHYDTGSDCPRHASNTDPSLLNSFRDAARDQGALSSTMDGEVSGGFLLDDGWWVAFASMLVAMATLVYMFAISVANPNKLVAARVTGVLAATVLTVVLLAVTVVVFFADATSNGWWGN